MYIAFFDSDKNSMGKMRDRLIKYTIVKDMELDVLWFEDITVEKVVKYVSAISIAFISLDCKELSEIGFKIAELNPNCYICYYKTSKCDLFPILHSRPYDFFISECEDNNFIQVLGEIISDYTKSRNVFYHETKRGLLCYPVRNILYLQSDMKYVNIVTSDGKAESIYAKLSEIEEEIYKQGNQDFFVRVHKSYIVNTFNVKGIDKSNHTVKLFSGAEIPISEAYYREALNKFKKAIGSEKLKNNVIYDVSSLKNGKPDF